MLDGDIIVGRQDLKQSNPGALEVWQEYYYACVCPESTATMLDELAAAVHAGRITEAPDTAIRTH